MFPQLTLARVQADQQVWRDVGRLRVIRDEPFVVFVIGMRINRFWKAHRWAPVAAAMPRMIRELSRQPDLGCLGAQMWFSRTIAMLQRSSSVVPLLPAAGARAGAEGRMKSNAA
ncbi:MAG: DUF4188 domain-containing protein [Methylobacteriaceae bacterium]|nr:DUF4188 domain-containing protein [Methylobacteriaceae bacterium]